MSITGTNINLTGGYAIITVILWIIVVAVGFGGVLLLAYWVLDYVLSKTLKTLKLLDLFKQFMFEHFRSKEG